MAFDKKYDKWNEIRLTSIVKFFGHKFFYMKKVLDLGSGHGYFAGNLRRLGADVTALDARKEHITFIDKKFPGMKTIRADLNDTSSIKGRYDLILDLGLICHLSDYKEHIKMVCAATTNLVLETAVCDSDESDKCIEVSENKEILDLSYNGKGCRPSSAAIEQVLSECGMTFRRIDDANLNVDKYLYNWKSKNNNEIDFYKRRFWIATKTNGPVKMFMPTKENLIKLDNEVIKRVEYIHTVTPKTTSIIMSDIKSLPTAMIDLKNTTFIIPLCIESKDREINARISISYLCKYLDTNIIIYEYDKTSQFANIAKTIDTHNNKLEHIFATNDNGVFHRTKFLNEMLAKVNTPIVINYDVDILLPPASYKKFSDLIANGNDLVYPYFWGGHTRQINYNGRDKILKSLSLDNLSASDYLVGDSQYGHCQFFNTASYIAGGMENEEFISWGPEDRERGYRFKKLGHNTMWSNDHSDFIYHLEHSRGANSSAINPFMNKNNKLFEHIKSLSKEKLRDYYNNISYIKKYTSNK